MNYEDYHSHPINKFIHFICIPIIVLTSCNLLSNFKFNCGNYYLELQEFITILLLIHYLTYGFFTFFAMFYYFYVIHTLSLIWRNEKNCMWQSFGIFVLAWVLQFFGHYIEGNRPALMTSIYQAFTEAPLFSFEYILPFKLH